MAEKTITLSFDGYWREPNISGLPASSGIYCVYTSTYNSEAKTVSIAKLIYIGEGDNVKTRVDGHEGWPTWKKELATGQVVCLSAATIASVDRTRAEAALIFKHEPKCNTTYKNAFPFDKTTINATGKTALVTASFTVNRTEN